MKWRIGCCLCLALIGVGQSIPTAEAHVLVSSVQACRWLSRQAQPLTHQDQTLFADARRLSQVSVPIYLDSPQAIHHVAHIPHAPYLTAIAGTKSQCVAVTSAWLAPLNPEERLWLTLVGIAGLQHPHTYRLMLHAAENPPKGLFSGIADWWGRRTADSAILASERKATQWLGEAHFPTARTALQELRHAPGFLQDSWLPSFPAQEQAVASG